MTGTPIDDRPGIAAPPAEDTPPSRDGMGTASLCDLDLRAGGDGLLDRLTDVARSLAAGDLSRVSEQGLLDALDTIEQARRALAGAGVEVLARLAEHGTATRSSGTDLPGLLVDRLRLSRREARTRVDAAADLGPRPGLSGPSQPALMPRAADALRAGAISDEHVHQTRWILGQVPPHIGDRDRGHVEHILVGLARQARPEHVRQAGLRLLAHLDPDGTEPSEKARRRRQFFQLDEPGRDGLSTGRFCISAELRSYIEAVLAKYARPGHCDPDDPGHTADGAATDADPNNRTGRADPAPQDGAETAAARDLRTPGQRNHDGLTAALRLLLASGQLGMHRGLPITVVITAELRDLYRAAGLGYTAGGAPVPMREVLRMASHAYHCLAVFDDDGRPIHFGRTRRIAEPDQRLVLYAGDRGCTFPGCTAPALFTEAHHIREWQDGGGTDVDNLTLACGPHHRLIGDGAHQWATTVAGREHRHPGSTLWHPPPSVDPLRRGRINHYHHPDRLLAARAGPGAGHGPPLERCRSRVDTS